MRSSTLLRTVALTALAVWGLAALPALAQQDPDQAIDPVADAARKAREKQRASGKPKRVITNDDMPSAPPEKPAATTANAEAASNEANASNGNQAGDADKDKVKDKDAANDKKDESYWRKRFQEVRDKLGIAEKELDVLQREENKNQVQYYSDPQKALVQQYNRADINEGSAKVAAKQKEVDGLKQRLSDLEDELRKSGGDPGWAR
jgi:hypothetical protein